MMAGTKSKLALDSEPNDFDAAGFESSASGDGLQVTVILTTEEGTQAALRLASALAKQLGLRIRLLAVHAVPFHFPLDRPPVSLDFLERRPMRLISESEIQADEAHVEVFLCRNRRECLRQVLNPKSLIVVGGRRRRWLNEARRMERWLGRLGHRVVFAEVEGRKQSAFILQQRLSAKTKTIGAPYEPRNLAAWNVHFGNRLDGAVFSVLEGMRKDMR